MEDTLKIKEQFGIDPQTIGLRHRGFWIVEKIEEEEELGNAKEGYLCVKARDGGYNPMDADACRYPNFVGTAQDGFDITYRYYYYKPLSGAVEDERKTKDELVKGIME